MERIVLIFSLFVGVFCNQFDLGFVLIWDNQTNGQPVFITTTPSGNYLSGNGKHDVMLGHGSFSGDFWKGGSFVFRTINQTRGQWSGQLNPSHDNHIQFCFLNGDNVTSGVGRVLNISNFLNLTLRLETYGTQQKIELIFGGKDNLTCGLWDKGWYQQSGPDHMIWMVDFCWTCWSDYGVVAAQYCYSRSGMGNKTAESFNVSCPMNQSSTVAPSTTSICKMGGSKATVTVMTTALVLSSLVSVVNGVSTPSVMVTTLSVTTLLLSASVKAGTLLLNGYGNWTNLTSSCFRYCNGNCTFGNCSCFGNGFSTCCDLGDNVTQCKWYPPFGSLYWEFWFSFSFWFLFVVVILILFWRFFVLCFGFKVKKKNVIITDGQKTVEVRGWCLKLFVLLCLNREAVSVYIGPDDFGKWFFDHDDFGFKVNFFYQRGVGGYLGDKCCHWWPSKLGGITCCSDTPNSGDNCYHWGSWDCRSFATGVGGWNDGCFCENANVVTWCCICHCDLLWRNFLFVYDGQPIVGSLLLTNGTDTIGLNVNQTGTYTTKFANVTISGCGTPTSFRAGFDGKHWANVDGCGTSLSKRPPPGSVTCSGTSNWGSVNVLCWCPADGPIDPLSRQLTIFTGNGSVFSKEAVGCDLNFNWFEKRGGTGSCSKWYCGDRFGLWCMITVWDGPCNLGGRIFLNGTVGVFCGSDGIYNGKKCNGTSFQPRSPGPYDPSSHENVGPKSGVDVFIDRLKKWLWKWFDYVVAVVIIVVVLVFLSCVLKCKK